jgi:putative oxidoreductase
MATIAHWFLRLPFAAVFLFHGIGKLANPAMAEAMQMPLIMFLMVGAAETLAGIGAIVGGIPAAPKRDLVTRLAGWAAAPVMLGAIAMVHWPQWSFVATEAKPMGGMEFQVTLLFLAIYFIATGAKNEQA